MVLIIQVYWIQFFRIFNYFLMFYLPSTIAHLLLCVTGHQFVECAQIMMWWSSNLGQWLLRNLGYVAYCYVFILVLTLPPFLLSNVILGGNTPNALTPPPPTSVVSPHRIILPTGRHLYPSHHANVPWLSPTLFCPCSPPLTLHHSRYACLIPVADPPLPLLKSLLPQTSSASPLPPASTTAPRVSPLPHTPSLYHKRRK